MYSCEQGHHTAAARTAYDSTSYLQPPCAVERSFQLSAHHRGGQVDPAAVAVGSAAGGVQQQQPRRASKKKHGARPPSRRSSTTVVATDVSNFRAMVQELTGFPPAAILRPMPRRIHAAVNNPALIVAAARQQGCGGDGRGQQAGSEATANTAGSGLTSDAPAVQPVMAQSPPCPLPPGVFDGLADIGSPVFDSWLDFAIE